MKLKERQDEIDEEEDLFAELLEEYNNSELDWWQIAAKKIVEARRQTKAREHENDVIVDHMERTVLQLEKENEALKARLKNEAS